MKPKWSEAPEWANYLAKDTNEGWFWFESKPKFIQNTWLARSIEVLLEGYAPAVCISSEDSINSLEEKPNEA